MEKMSKKVTCGILIKTDEGFLLCHPSGRDYDKGCYDIPKGYKEEGETEFNCMARELKEETGLIMTYGRENPLLQWWDESPHFKINIDHILNFFRGSVSRKL